ncbi:MAG: saccharopine dehydrogenase NADP-binding domain-containing protein, partial [Methanothrix sp.]
MRALVFGGTGRIGSAAAWDLARAEDVEEVGIVGKREEGLKRAAAWIGSDKIRLHRQDIAEEGGTMRLMDGYDVGLFALPDRRTSYRALEMAIDSSLPAVDVLEEYHRRPDVYETEGLAIPAGMAPDEYGDSLHDRAVENGVT